MKKSQMKVAIYNEWILAQYANNENYYYSTLAEGIPDGDGEEIVKDDLRSGFYDDDLNDMYELYKSARKAYQKDGYYINGEVYNYLEAVEKLAKEGKLITSL